jgi:hypothetical protein
VRDPYCTSRRLAQAPLARPPQLIIEHRYTRDARVPLAEDDLDMDCGWRSIPIPPTDDESWVIFDTSHDRRTGWRRIRLEVVP